MYTRIPRFGFLFGLCPLVLVSAAHAALQADCIMRTSVGSLRSDGQSASGNSDYSFISADGQVVAFRSSATSIVTDDGNHLPDVFVRDLATGVNERLSLGPGGVESNGNAWGPILSEDGSIVAFTASSTNLVTGDTNGAQDIFVRDRTLGVTSRVSVATGGVQADGPSFTPSISADGRFVAFASNATNLVPGDTNGFSDAFVHDRTTGVTVRVSVTSSGAQSHGEFCAWTSLSADGSLVTFDSSAGDLVPGAVPGTRDVFLHDRSTGTTMLVSRASDGTPGNLDSTNSSLSADGRFVAFSSQADNLVPGDTTSGQLGYDVFVRDLATGLTTRESVDPFGGEANGWSSSVKISADGRHVAFTSEATNLVPGDTNGLRDTFVRDRYLGQTCRASVSTLGVESDDASSLPSLSGDGRKIVFGSYATTLVPSDTNPGQDVFVSEHAAPDIDALCFADGSAGACPCGNGAGVAEGCAHSGGTGASLWVSGSVSVASDDLVFRGHELVPGQGALLFTGPVSTAGMPFGDGLACVGGPIVRLGVAIADSGGSAQFGPGLAGLAGWSAGTTSFVQAWLRDPLGSPCGSGFNLTDAVAVGFEP